MQLEPLSRIGILDASRSDMGGVVAFFRPRSQGDDPKVLHNGLRCLRLFRTHGRAITLSLIEARDKGLPEGTTTSGTVPAASEVEEIHLHRFWHAKLQPVLGDPPEEP